MFKITLVQPFRALLLALASFCVVTSASAGGWVDDWFDQATTTGAGSLKTQQRGYYTAGALQARWRMTNDFPVTASPPRFSAGCGGIDIFGGGFSYMDPEFLVEKFERAIQAAPAIAFSMAMSEFCQVCKTTMETMEQITNYLNSIQVNDCRMAKGLATMIVEPGDRSLYKGLEEKAMQGYGIAEGLLKNTQDSEEKVRSSGGAAPFDTKAIVAECPAVFRDIFTGGSVVKNVAGMAGLDTYADLMRGLIGDVEVSYDSSVNNYKVSTVGSCKGNDPGDGFDLLTGSLQKKSEGVGGVCSVANTSGVLTQIEAKLTTIADHYRPVGDGGGALQPQEKVFINSAPYPLALMLRDAVRGGYADEAISKVKTPLATAYAARMLDDIHKMTRVVLSKADEVSKQSAQSSGNQNKCNPEFLKPAIDQIRVMDMEALRWREIAMKNYGNSLSELAANLQYSKSLLDERRRSIGETATGLR